MPTCPRSSIPFKFGVFNEVGVTADFSYPTNSPASLYVRTPSLTGTSKLAGLNSKPLGTS
jgi:hypothetical protein